VNHLAHLVLAGPSDGLRLGALLGDHVKGLEALDRLPPDWARGVRLHRRIDRRCDEHPRVRALVRSWEGDWVRYGPIALDILFDTMLTRHWARFGPTPLPVFAAEIDRLLDAHRASLPMRLRQFSRWARAHSLWTRYDDRQMLKTIFDGVQRRHGRPSPLAEGLSRLDGWEGEIEAAFLEVFRDLQGEIAEASY
jgi:acyl carrier protein phosphodiesterase